RPVNRGEPPWRLARARPLRGRLRRETVRTGSETRLGYLRSQMFACGAPRSIGAILRRWALAQLLAAAGASVVASTYHRNGRTPEMLKHIVAVVALAVLGGGPAWGAKVFTTALVQGDTGDSVNCGVSNAGKKDLLVAVQLLH